MDNIIFDKFIYGFPSVKKKARGDRDKPKIWKEAIIDQTLGWKGKVKCRCKMKVVFMFDESQFPHDCPFGPDLDNHLKSLQDALNETIFLNAPGKDSCIVELRASKFKSQRKTGVRLKIWKYL